MLSLGLSRFSKFFKLDLACGLFFELDHGLQLVICDLTGEVTRLKTILNLHDNSIEPLEVLLQGLILTLFYVV